MLQIGAALIGYGIETNEGRIGTVSEFLFDDRTWKIRWLVVDTGNWLPERLVLVHPSAIGQADYVRRTLPVALTKGQIEAGPAISPRQPVSRQMEYDLYDYYGWDPAWDSSFYGADAAGPVMPPSRYADDNNRGGSHGGLSHLQAGDPHLRSLSTVAGYGIHASDGPVGHVENFLLEDDAWGIRSLIVDTGNPRPGTHVLISPDALRTVDWSKQQVFVDISRDRVNASPPWAPFDVAERGNEKRLRRRLDRSRYGSRL